VVLSLKIWEWDFPQLWRAIRATWFSLTPHFMVTLWQTRANCLGTGTWRDSSSNQPSLKPYRLIVCTFGQHESCMAGLCKIAVTKMTERHGTSMYKLRGIWDSAISDCEDDCRYARPCSPIPAVRRDQLSLCSARKWRQEGFSEGRFIYIYARLHDVTKDSNFRCIPSTISCILKFFFKFPIFTSLPVGECNVHWGPRISRWS